jgi:diguanylate cyclase (GGDEF) domain
MISAAGLISFGLDNLSMSKSFEARETELKQLAITDDLTGLYNRRFLDEYLRIQLAMAKRQQTRIAFLSIDIDHFKMLNDMHGHATGDRVLVKVGAMFRTSIRASDLAVRIGGEEFLIVIPDTDREGAVIFAERLCEQFAATEFCSEPPVRLTVSIGVAIYPDDGVEEGTLLRTADEALYRSKREGRNRITVGSASGETPRKPGPSAT